MAAQTQGTVVGVFSDHDRARQAIKAFIERRPVDGKAASGDAGREEIRIPVSEEQVNVQKQTVVKEEVTVGKRKVQDTKRVDADLKKEEIKVDTKGSANVRNKK